MNFVWFWTFWHWSKESCRNGVLLRGPLHGVGGHWDEWYRHEASPADRLAIEEVGRTEAGQHRFISWLFEEWSSEANREGNRLVPRFVAGQLAHLPPFAQWSSFERYRAGYGAAGIAAIVLAEASAGESGDVRPVEAVILPADKADASAPEIVAEGFEPDGQELSTARAAAQSVLAGPGLMGFLALWIATGRRPYPRWQQLVLAGGWLFVGGIILYLLVGPEIDESLQSVCAVLLAVWTTLVVQALWVVIREVRAACRQGKRLGDELQASQVRLRMNGGLTLQGASAGLAFCLNTVLALFRAHPGKVRTSWLWQQCYGRLQLSAGSWAATGVITPEGWLKPVMLDPKFRACLMQAKISHILTPGQRDARQRAIDNMARTLTTLQPSERTVTPPPVSAANIRLGFATETHQLNIHRCRHVAQSLMSVGGFTSRWQTGVNVFALGASMIMAVALPDLRDILLPPPAPEVVAPGSPSPYYLWVSLDTPHADSFRVVLESEFWANRVASVNHYSGANASVRAELAMHRLAENISRNEENGVVWVERRRHFLTREFAPGERVGRYPISYLTRLPHE